MLHILTLHLGDKWIDIQKRDTKYRDTPESIARKHGHKGIVAMLKKGGQLRQARKYVPLSLSFACKVGDLKQVNNVLTKVGVDVNETSGYGYTPLMWAIKRHKRSSALDIIPIGIIKILLHHQDLQVNQQSMIAHNLYPN